MSSVVKNVAILVTIWICCAFAYNTGKSHADRWWIQRTWQPIKGTPIFISGGPGNIQCWQVTQLDGGWKQYEGPKPLP